MQGSLAVEESANLIIISISLFEIFKNDSMFRDTFSFQHFHLPVPLAKI